VGNWVIQPDHLFSTIKGKKASLDHEIRNLYFIVKFLLTIDPGGITFREIFNLFWLGPNGSRLFFIQTK